ncbi:MAG: hypothetical protein ACJAYB_002178 [Psychromonas sp.]|jgi:hypothetical protein
MTGFSADILGGLIANYLQKNKPSINSTLNEKMSSLVKIL